MKRKMTGGNLAGKNLANFGSVNAAQELVRALAGVRAAARADVLDGLDDEAVRLLAETALNVIIGVVPTSGDQLRRLHRHREQLLELTASKTSGARRRELLVNDNGLLNGVVDTARRAL